MPTRRDHGGEGPPNVPTVTEDAVGGGDSTKVVEVTEAGDIRTMAESFGWKSVVLAGGDVWVNLGEPPRGLFVDELEKYAGFFESKDGSTKSVYHFRENPDGTISRRRGSFTSSF